MYRIPGVVSAATATPAPAVPRVQPTRGPPPDNPQTPEDGNAAGPAPGLNDVVGQLLTASLDLQAALRLMGDHPASGKICHAMDELDQAIQVIRDTIGHLAGDRPDRQHPHEHNPTPP